MGLSTRSTLIQGIEKVLLVECLINFTKIALCKKLLIVRYQTYISEHKLTKHFKITTQITITHSTALTKPPAKLPTIVQTDVVKVSKIKILIIKYTNDISMGAPGPDFNNGSCFTPVY